MSKRNRQRRRESLRRGAGEQGNPFVREAGGGEAGGGTAERAVLAWRELLRRVEAHGSKADHDRAIAALVMLPDAVVDDTALLVLDPPFGRLWEHGWQPSEVVRLIRRRAGATAAGLVEVAILADHARRSGQALDPRWAQQLADLDSQTVSVRGNWFTNWRRSVGVPRGQALLSAAAVVVGLTGLPVLDRLLPRPGHPDDPVYGARRSSVDDAVLARVRKLLAKAEATEFEEEASALTAKAQELMTRHAIAQAVVDRPADAGDDRPVLIRVPIDAPYVDAKGVLLEEVARANRCRTILYKGFDLCAVAGHAGDLAVVEVLFTSLLVQAQNALQEAVGRGGPRSRSTAFRSSFYLGFAGRIGERLGEANGAALDDDGGAAALPVLRSREGAVQKAFEEWFGATLALGTVRGGYDAEGRASGRVAADRAALDSGAIRSAH